MTGRVYRVKVACPACGNRNRATRRACRTCGRTGLVEKNLPAEADEETP